MRKNRTLRGQALLLGVLFLLLSPAVGPGSSAQEDGAGQAVPEQPAVAGTQEASPGPAPGEMRIRWQDWSRDTFRMAMQLRRPVMLYLRAEDCRLCQDLEARVFTRESVVRKIANSVVPVIADADMRPDLAGRYLTGAVPTTIFLLPNGEPIYEVDDASSLERVGGYFRTPEGLIAYLGQVEDYFRQRGKELADKARQVAKLEAEIRDYDGSGVPLDRLDEIIVKVREGFDFTHGGYGRGWKFIQDEPVRLFRLLAAAGGDAALRQAVAISARGILAGAIHDEVDGGFHHFATTRDWGVPAWEKRLQVNGQALRLLTAAAAMDPEDRESRQALQRTASFLRTVLAREGGGLAFAQQGSLGPDDAGSYFQADAAARATLRPPALVSRSFTEATAVAAVGLMEAGALLADREVEDLGLEAVDFLAAHLYDQGRGMARYLGGDGRPRLRGILVDQVAAMEAFLVAYQVRGREPDLDRARDLLQFCRANLNRPAGYFVDRVQDGEAVGALRRPLVSAALNGRLALVAFRLAALTGDETLRQVGNRALGALPSAIARMNRGDAPYAEAVLAAAGPQVRVVLAPDSGAEMRRAALLLPVAGLVVEHDGEAVAATLCRDAVCVGPLTSAAELAAAMNRAPGKEAPLETNPRPDAPATAGEGDS